MHESGPGLLLRIFVRIERLKKLLGAVSDFARGVGDGIGDYNRAEL
jgi:hypothetical protein